MTKLDILGTGCAKCEQLAANAEAAAKQAGVAYEINKVTDIEEIMRRGVVLTPALSVDGQVRVVGKVPPVEELRAMLESA